MPRPTATWTFTRLMDAGADGSAGWRGCLGRTLLGAAAYGRGEKMVRALLRVGAKADLDVRFGAKQESALHVAARRGADKAFTTLMLAGAGPNVLNGDMESPLHLVAQAGNHVMVNNLLLRGAFPDAKTRGKQKTPLHLAALKGHVMCVSNLVVGGADMNSRNNNGEPPLYLAAKYNRIAVVHELLAAGAQFNFRQNGDWSPLDCSAAQGHVDVVRALVQQGSSAKACDPKGFTVLHCAAQTADNGDVIRALLELGADIEAKTTSGGLTPLRYGVSRRIASSGTIHALLKGGAKVNNRDANEGTPLHRACLLCCVDGVELLLRWGADETLVDQDGKTAEELVGERILDDGRDEEQRKADEQRVRHMLARAPADRSWRRRGWLVLARACPEKVHFAQESSKSGASSVDNPIASCEGLGGGGDGKRDLIGRVVGLDADGVFRLVVGFL